MNQTQTLEIPVKGMDCIECTQHVQHALAALPGVADVNVFLAGEKAVLQLDLNLVTMQMIRRAVESAGYSVPQAEAQPVSEDVNLAARASEFSRKVLVLFGLVFGAVLLIVVAGEWLGLLEQITARVPWVIGVAAVIATGWPVFLNVIRATLRRQVIAHTLMTVGVVAALAVGEWATAAVVVFFMRMGDYAEKFTTEKARRAVKDLNALAPQTARLEKDGGEIEIPVEQVQPGDIILVRPGDKIAVDGEVISGQATVDQSTITGEAMPVEAGPGARVYAATLATLGSLRVRASHIGQDTTFGKVIRMVEQAEANRADIQRISDRFSAWYLPVVGGIALLTFLLRHDPLATAAVLVVACSCSFALATPIAMLASIGAGARRGLLIKGGKYLEALARADVLLVDKTGTLTLGQPRVSEIILDEAISEDELLILAASVERYSEHPLAEAVRRKAQENGLKLEVPENFEATPGQGVKGIVRGRSVAIGNERFVLRGSPHPQPISQMELRDELEAQGKTLLYISIDGQPAGMLALTDTLRPEVPKALAEVRRLGIRKVELLTGDNPRAASSLAEQLGVDYRAGLLPEDKIAIVRQYQAKGHVVVMVGDGVNDAPALAQADVGIAMGAAGSAVAIEAAHAALMRQDWGLVPELLRIAQRTMRIVKGNLAFTVVYNLVGLSLAAFGILPPVLAAAAQSLPDLGILGNSSRLIRQ